MCYEMLYVIYCERDYIVREKEYIVRDYIHIVKDCLIGFLVAIATNQVGSIHCEVGPFAVLVVSLAQIVFHFEIQLASGASEHLGGLFLGVLHRSEQYNQLCHVMCIRMVICVHQLFGL